MFRIILFLLLVSCVSPEKLNNNFITHIRSGEKVDFQKFVKKGGNINHHDNLGKSALHYAAEDGNIELTNNLLKLNADINIQNFKKETPLILATKNGHTKIIDLLLQKNAKQDLTDNNGHTAFYYAVKNSNKTAIDSLAQIESIKRDDIYKLITNKINPDLLLIMQEKDLNINDVTETNNSLLHHAIKNNNQKIIKYLIENNINITIQNNLGNTPLHETSNLKTVQILLKYGQEKNIDFSYKNLAGKTIFHNFANNCEILTSLLNAAKNINELVNIADNDGNIPLHFSNKEACITSLIANGSNVKYSNKDGNTPLYLADSTKILLLLKAGGNINATHDPEGDSAFAYLVKIHFSEKDFLKHIIQEYEPNINAKNNLNIQPIHYIAMANPFWFKDKDKSAALQILIEAGSELNNLDKLRGYTALHYTSQLVQIAATETLLKAGSNPFITSNMNMATAESLAVNSNKANIAEKDKIKRLFAQYGSNLESRKENRGGN